MPPQAAGEHRPLDVPAQGHQILGALGVRDADDVLLDDRSGIEVGGHVVAGGADELYAAGVGLVVRTGADETGQEAVVNVDDPSRVPVTDLRGHDLHVTGQYHHVTVHTLEARTDLLKGRCFAVGPYRDVDERDAGGFGQRSQFGVVGDDQGNGTGEVTASPAVEQVGEAVVLPTGQDDHILRNVRVAQVPVEVQLGSQRAEPTVESGDIEGERLGQDLDALEEPPGVEIPMLRRLEDPSTVSGYEPGHPGHDADPVGTGDGEDESPHLPIVPAPGGRPQRSPTRRTIGASGTDPVRWPDLDWLAVDPVVQALAEQQAETSGLLVGLTDVQWGTATRCAGWDVADVVLHLAQSDELAIASLEGRARQVLADRVLDRRAPDAAGPDTEGGPTTVDELAAATVEQERGATHADLLRRWQETAAALLAGFEAMDLSARVPWMVGDLSARTLATTRLAETWIHTGDVAGAVGVTLPATDRLELIARLAWRTLPYAFASSGRTLQGPVAFRLFSPGGAHWDFVPDQPALTTISGPASDLCDVAARRTTPETTALTGDGPDADVVLALVRTYA